MNTENIPSGGLKSFLAETVGKFAGFVNQVIHDDDFLTCVGELLPFDGMAYAWMNVLPVEKPVRKMGVMVMRMDVEPPLFSLAVNMTIDRGGGRMSDVQVFLDACKTIEELQEAVKDGKFEEKIMEQYGPVLEEEDGD